MTFKSCICKYFLKALLNLSATTDFPSLCVEYISMSFLTSHDFIDLLWNLLPLSTHILFGLGFYSCKIFWKALVIIIPFLSFKGIAHAYLLKIQIKQNKKLKPLSKLFVNL